MENDLNNFQKAREEEKRMEGTVENCPFRTKFHIMPPVGWLNDPNGLCQFRGVYHAYFQYSPLNVNGGGGYWGHCTSRDLLHWEYKEPVLTTDIPEDKSGVYSGSALIEDGRMYLFYTGNVKKPGSYDYIDSGRISTQILVESDDGQHMSEKVKLLGMEDYPEDITQHVRDPKVWKEDGHYYMVLGARARAWDENGKRRDKGGLLIYQSGHSLPGRSQDPEETFREWDMGFDFYAPQSFQADDGRRILIGWAGMPDTTETHRNLSVSNGWQHCLTLPCELEYHDGKIFRMPVREIYDLDWEEAPVENGRFHWAGRALKLDMGGICGERTVIRLGDRGNGVTVTVEENRVELSFLDEKGVPSRCGGGRGKRIGRTEGPVEELLVLIDSSIMEIFVNGGETVFTTRLYLEAEERVIDVSGYDGYVLEMI